MTAQVSRMVSDRALISNTVLSAVSVHGPEITPALEKVLFPNGVPQNLTIAAVLEALGGVLQTRVGRLEAADLEHAVELSDDEAYRATRAECYADLRGYLASVRTGLATNYGPLLPGAYNLAGPTPEDAATLLNMADKAESLLRSRPLTEKPKRAGLKMDPIVVADDIKSLASDLRKALSDVEREKREAQITLNGKAEAMAAWAVGYQGVADTVAALFFLAGRPDLAERVRPTARRRAGLPETEDGATAPANEGTANPPPPAPPAPPATP